MMKTFFILSLIFVTSFADVNYFLIDDCLNEEDFRNQLDSRCTYISKLDFPSATNCSYYRVSCPFAREDMVTRSLGLFSTFDPDKIATDDLAISVAKKIDTQLLVDKEKNLKNLLGYNDASFPMQFAFGSDGSVQSTAPGFSMSVLTCHSKGFKGKGIVAMVLDDGCEISHPDIQANVDSDLTHNYSSDSLTDGDHGTACSGLIGAIAKNRLCSVGFAPEITLGAVKVIGNGVFVSDQANALTQNQDRADIYSNSWGPPDDGFLLKNLDDVLLAAQASGVTKGRNGKGSIYLFANGNGKTLDSCGADGFAGSPYVIAVQSVEETGVLPFYGESCAHILISSYVGNKNSPTIGLTGKCKSVFIGTSAATPMISGSVALILEANPNLTWRDVQHVIARAARLTQSLNKIWQITPGGLFTSSSLGFGVLDVTRAVYLAQKWKNVGPLCIAEFKYGNTVTSWSDGYTNMSNDNVITDIFAWYAFIRNDKTVPNYVKINSGEATEIKLNLKSNQQGTYTIPEQQGKPELKNMPCNAEIVEWLIVEVKTIHACRGSLTVTMKSPSNTTSVLLSSRENDIFAGQFTHKFKVLQSMGEKLDGLWKLRFIDNGICKGSYVSQLDPGYRGHVTSISISAFTTATQDSAYTINKALLDTQILSTAKLVMKSGATIVPTLSQLSSSIDESLSLSYSATVDTKK